MIQRIQSIYLLLAFAGIIVSAVFQGLYWAQPCTAAQPIDDAHSAAWSLWPVGTAVLMLLSAALVVSALFLFKNRGRQLLLASFSQLFIVATTAFILKDVVVGNMAVKESLGSLLPQVLAFLFVLLAKRGIRHDEELVRAADRIR